MLFGSVFNHDWRAFNIRVDELHEYVLFLPDIGRRCSRQWPPKSEPFDTTYGFVRSERRIIEKEIKVVYPIRWDTV
jgi:hypothetical protein